jgi:hypothetical protein
MAFEALLCRKLAVKDQQRSHPAARSRYFSNAFERWFAAGTRRQPFCFGEVTPFKA